MKLLDLFCGAGGAAMGYSLAGFTEITGVDIAPQPHYPFHFLCTEALAYVRDHGKEYDVIHASPPCQAYSEATPLQYRALAPDLITQTRTALLLAGKPYVIENVEGARKHLQHPLMLCGTMFGLPLWRHRYFECMPRLFQLLPACDHRVRPVLVSGSTHRKNERRRDYSIEDKRWAMQISWMNTTELDEAIPPIYTQWIGQQICKCRERC